MLGGLMFEVCTGGMVPFHWIDPRLTRDRRLQPARELFRPIGSPVTLIGIGGLSTLDAAALDEQQVVWAVRTQTAGTWPGAPDDVIHCEASTSALPCLRFLARSDICSGAASRLDRLVKLMRECMSENPRSRPSLATIQTTLLGA
jgi:hypothetical protein